MRRSIFQEAWSLLLIETKNIYLRVCCFLSAVNKTLFHRLHRFSLSKFTPAKGRKPTSEGYEHIV